MAQQPKVVKVGPGGRSNGPRPKVENPGKVFKRILAYVMSRYKAQVIVVLCCILLAVFAQLQGVMFSQTRSTATFCRCSRRAARTSAAWPRLSCVWQSSTAPASPLSLCRTA